MLSERGPLHLVARGEATRCAVCHDAPGDAHASCDGCGCVLHRECAAAGCPTLGCARAGARPAFTSKLVDKADDHARPPRPRVAVVLASFALACLALIAYLGLALMAGAFVGGGLGLGSWGICAAVLVGIVAAPVLAGVMERLQRMAQGED